MKDVVVIGGGISGLLTALALQKEGKRVTLLEKGELGNVVRSYQVEGDSGIYRVDTGPHILTRFSSGPLRQLMDLYCDTTPQVVPHGNYYLRMNGKFCQFPWALKDFLHFDAVPKRERITLVQCIIEGILLKDKSVTVKDFLQQYRLGPHTETLVDALCYFLAGVPMREVPISRFWDTQKYKDSSSSIIKRVVNLLEHRTRTDQFYPVGGIQAVTDSILHSFKGTVVKDEALHIDTNNKHVTGTEKEYPYDFVVYSGMAKELHHIVELPAEYKHQLSQLKTTTALTLWVGTRDNIITKRGSEIWVDTTPPCWLVPVSIYDSDLAPPGCQLLGFAFSHEQCGEKKALQAVEQVFPSLDIDMLHYQVLQPDKAAWTTAPFPSITTPLPDVYLVGTDTIKRSMGITRAAYSVLQLLDILKGEERL